MEIKQRFRKYLPVVIDLETGGVDASKHALLQIAVVLLGWENDKLVQVGTHEWSVEPHPDTELDPASLEITGIDPFDTSRNAQNEEHAIRELFRLVRNHLKSLKCQRALLTGHNAHFDRTFLRVATVRNKVGRDPFHPFSVLDTVSLAALAYGHTRLDVSCQRAGIGYDKDKAHEATYDAKVTAALFCRIVNSSEMLYSIDS